MRRQPALLLFAVVVAGCEGQALAPGGPVAVQVQVVVNPASAALQVGAAQQFTAVVTGAADPQVRWSVLQADAGVITAGGRYTAPARPGVFDVVATSVADPSRSGSVPVTVTTGPPAVAVTVTPGTAALGLADSQPFVAAVTGTANTAVTWSVVESGGGAVSASGLYTAPQVPGSFHVVATSVAEPLRSGTATVSVALPSVTTYTPLVAMPAHDGARMEWLTGEISIVKDVVGGDLVAFFKGGGGLSAAVSTDLGAHWRWVDPAVPIPHPGPPTAIHQDSLGKVHLLSPYLELDYTRLALARDASGHVTGFSAEVLALPLPVPVNSNMNLRGQVVPGKDQAGHDVLFYCVYDDPGNAARGRIQAGMTTPAAGLTPTSPAHFVKLDGTVGATLVMTLPPGDVDAAITNSHHNAVELAQHPRSRDLWFQWGPIDTGDTLLANRNPVRRLRATPSGASTFALGAAVDVEAWNGTSVQLGSVVSTPNFVWLMRTSPTAGVVIDKVDAQGRVTAGALPSPLPTPSTGGYFVLAVDAAERQAWVGGWTSYDSQPGSGSPAAFWASHWDGAAWKKFSDVTDVHPADTWGVGRSVGWDHGLAMVLLDPATFAPSFATLRTVP